MSNSPPMRMIFHLPREADRPVLIQGKQSPWKLLYATKEQVQNLGPEWGVRGVYLLFGPGNKDPSNYWVRVGKSAPGTLRKRVPAHVKDKKIKDSWTRALLVCSTVGNGFNSAEAGYMEGQLANLLDEAPHAELHEGQRDQDDTLEAWELDELQPVIEVVLAVMRVLGYPPDQPEVSTAAATPKPTSAKTQTKFSVGDLIDAGLLETDSQLKPVTKGFGQTALVNEDGSLTLDGQVFASPSAAAVHLVGHNINGWVFWATTTDEGKAVSLADLRKMLAETLPTQTSQEVESGSGSGAGPLSPLISAGLLQIGAKLVAKSKGQLHSAKVSADGLVERGGTAGTPSAIAKTITDYPVNGWKFWRADIDGQPTLSSLKEKLPSPERDT